jgi:ABC-type spermidine/putrescine transport system permease subunit I
MSPKQGRSSAWLLVGIPSAFLAVLFILPILYMCAYSVLTYSQKDLVVPTFTLDNYREIMSAYYIRLFSRTIRVSLVTTAVAGVLGFPVAYFIARSGPRVKAIAVFLVISPLMISTIVRVFGTTILLGRKGVLNELLNALGLPSLQILHSEPAIVVGLVQMLLPLMVLPIVSAIERIPVNLEEAATNLGANWFQVFRSTILPLSLPGVISGAILVYTLSISALVIPTLLGGASDRMLGQQIYDQMFVAYNWPAASALSVVLVILTGIAAAVGILLANRFRVEARWS